MPPLTSWKRSTQFVVSWATVVPACERVSLSWPANVASLLPLPTTVAASPFPSPVNVSDRFDGLISVTWIVFGARTDAASMFEMTWAPVLTTPDGGVSTIR